MKNFIILMICFSLVGCRKGQQTSFKASLTNTTTHSIVVLPYKNGYVFKQDTIRLQPGETLEIANGSQRGLVASRGFYSKYFGSSDDSAIVVFDKLYKMTHYANPPAVLAVKHYLYVSIRNIGNPLSFKFELQKPSSNFWQNNHLYEFVEQDYLDAK